MFKFWGDNSKKDEPEISLPDQLTLAVFHDELGVVNSILGQINDVNIVDSKGRLPIFAAIEMENIRFIELFVAHGADVNKTDSAGWTALHMAVDISIDGTTQSNGHKGEEPISIIRFLIDSGARVDATCLKGKTPLDLAKDMNSLKLINCMESE